MSCFGREAADREADRAVRQFVVAAQRTQHIRRFQLSRRAGRTGRHRHVLDRHDQRFAFDVVEADVQVVRHALFHVAVDIHLFDFRQTVAADGRAACRMRSFSRRHFFARRCGRLRPCRRSGASASVPERMPRSWPPPCICASIRTRGLRRTYSAPMPFGPYVLCAENDIRSTFSFLQVDRDLAGRLRRVDVENDALFAADLADRLDVLDHADLVVHQHDRDQDRVRTQRGLELLEVDQAVVLRRPDTSLRSPRARVRAGVEHGLVLGLHRDDVLALALVEMRGALDREVVRLGRAGRPDDFARIGVDQRGDFSRASSTRASAAQPYAWLREAGLPNCSRRYGIILSTTRGSIGVVARSPCRSGRWGVSLFINCSGDVMCSGFWVSCQAAVTTRYRA